MKKINYIISVCLVLLLGIGLVSCEDYLDKSPESDITERDVFGNFNSFQGFIEQMYNCIQDPDKGGAWNRCLFG